ncbi:MAG: M15 family metallopeptidase [Sandaracinaceae bacterium]
MPPDGWTDISTLPGVSMAIGYHRPDNFTGAVLPGYENEGAWLVRPAARALGEALDELGEEGLGLVVYDAYRPVRATLAMVAWCVSNGRDDLLDGWVGRRSRHNRGVAVDVGLTQRGSGARVPMGVWDRFDEGSGHGRAVGAERVHRRRLRDAMERAGFAPYRREWWHYEFPMADAPPPLDVPY